MIENSVIKELKDWWKLEKEDNSSRNLSALKNADYIADGSFQVKGANCIFLLFPYPFTNFTYMKIPAKIRVEKLYLCDALRDMVPLVQF